MNRKLTAILIEDEVNISSLIATILTGESYKVLTAHTGKEGLSLITSQCPDIILLDLGLPDMDGLQIIRKVREFSRIPILVISARTQEEEKVQALDCGADDYITKPFNPVEIVARVKAQLRRASRSGSDILTVRELTLDTTTFQLAKNGKQILLTPMEYKILALLMRSPGRIYTKIQLYEGAIGNYFEGDDNTMMVHISKLRDKIEDDPKSPRYIITVRGLGYKLEK